MSARTAIAAPRLFVVVPARAEFGNGNLPRFLASLARQRLALDVVLLINNRTTDADWQSDAWHDNRAALAWLAGIRTGTATASGGAFAREAATIGGSALVLHPVDLTDGFARNMGQLRSLGLARVRELAQGLPENRVLVLSADADCLYGTFFARRLLALFGDARTRLVILPMLYFPLAPEAAIVGSYFRQHFPVLVDQVSRQLSRAPSARLGAPQLAARLDLLTEHGDYADLVEGEDFELGQRLVAREAAVLSGDPRLVVWTADRAVDGGFESGARLDGLRDMTAGREQYENPLAACIAGRRGEPEFRARLATHVALCGRDIAALSEAELWALLPALGIPPVLDSLAAVREALRVALDCVAPGAQAARDALVRDLGRRLELAEKRLGPLAGIRAALWPQPNARAFWLEASAAMLFLQALPAPRSGPA